MNKGGRGRDGVLPVGRGPCKDRPRDIEESLASFSRFSSCFLILLHWKQTFLESQVLGLQTWISGPVPLGPGETLSTQRGPFSPPRNLLSNPFNCNCHLAWLGKWLRKRRIVSGNPRCQKPFFLKEIPIQDVAIQDFTCDGEEAGCRVGPGKEVKREGRRGQG